MLSFVMMNELSVAQSSSETFGRNRLQFKTMKWRYISTYNFDIYYYDGGKELAEFTAEFAESDFERVTNLTGFTPYSKIKL
ncbi:MAG TPA: hypothetical protein VF691_12520, partial [Cytophagaceae bacterium]